jgi:hypothetical protein
MAAYESELTNFLRDLKKSKPGIEDKQREGRAIWWDKQLDADELQRWQASQVRQTAYVYYAPEPPPEDAPAIGSGPVKPTIGAR